MDASRTAQTVADLDPAWFRAESWQVGEREVDAHVAVGNTSVFDDIDAFLAHLSDAVEPIDDRTHHWLYEALAALDD